MGLLDGIFNLFDSEIDIKIQDIEKSDKGYKKSNAKVLQKNYEGYDIKSAYDEFYYEDMPIPQKYTIDTLPEKRYDYVFNSENFEVTLGLTCFGKQSVAGYQLDVCEVVHINNSTGKISVLENIMGVLDRERLKEEHEQHLEYIDFLIFKVFAEKRLDKIITEYKGHFGMIRYNSEEEKFQLCSIKPVIEKLNKYYMQTIAREDIIPMDAININNKRRVN